MRVQLSKEWITGTIQPYGNVREKQVTSLRKKIYDHRDSGSHKQAIELKKEAGNEKLKTVVTDSQKQHEDSTCKVFRTAYYIAKNNRPFLDHAHLIELQEVNGIQAGRMLHSNVVAADIVKHIAHEMKAKLCAAIISAKSPFSVLIDESTSLGQKSCLIVYLRCSISDSFEPTTVFLDLLELSALDADTITDTLMTCLHSNGLTADILHDCWLGLAVDGASVMLGRKGGVYTKLKQQFPKLIGWHCFNHRLELSVNDAIRACTEVNHFKIFMQKLYTLYSASPKNRRGLERVAVEVGVALLKIGRVLDVRWVASSFRTVKAVWTSYPALYGHFSQAATDASLDSKDRAQFKGLAGKLSSSSFLLNLGLMYDALEELSDLSESLQADSINLNKANRLIARQVEFFVSRKAEGGEHYVIASDAVSAGVYRGVTIVRSTAKSDKEVNRSQFYQALADSISARLMPVSERPIADCVDVLFPGTWPTDVSPEYGEKELKKAASKFLVPYSRQLKEEYRDYKDVKGVAASGQCLRRLVGAVHTLPVSTAECERGFSQMNIICTPLRTCLAVENISTLLFIAIVGPPLNLWQPLPYVKSWLAKGRHAATDLGKAKSAKPFPEESRVALWKCF